MISLEDENEREEFHNQNINSRVELNNFLMTRGGKRSFIQTEKNENMHIRHVLEIEIG